MNILNNTPQKKHGWVRWILIFWGLATMGTAFYIPVFDFGFDGVKFWFALSVLMLFGFSPLAFGVKYYIQMISYRIYN